MKGKQANIKQCNRDEKLPFLGLSSSILANI